MPNKPVPNTLVYDTVEKVEKYWNTFRPPGITQNFHNDKWLQQSEFLEKVSMQSRVCVTLWDVISNRFLYAVDKTHVLGDNASRFMDPDGVDYSLSQFPVDHLQAMLVIQLQVHDYYTKHPELIPNDLVINQDAEYNTSKGKIHILQQACIVEVDPNNNPLLFLSYLYDITHLKKSSASLVITSSKETLMWNYHFLKKKLVEIKPLSTREKKLLLLLSEGKQTKQIADELGISPHTVDTHRRNMLKKTCCIDTTALVAYSKMVGLI